MTALHYIQVRRARGLAMPLPPKPKARPLGPPTLLRWKGVDIRVRADIERVGWTWDEFLDGLVAYRLDREIISEGLFALQAIERLVLPADLEAHRGDVRRRVLAQRKADRAARAVAKAKWDATIAEKGHLGAFLDYLKGSHAA